MIEHQNLIRDKKTNAVINTNLDEYRRLVAEREKEKEINCIKNDISSLRQELFQIKKLIGEALNLKGN